MNPDTIKNSIQAVIDGLTPLAQKLQVPIEGLWKWALKHNYAVAFEYLFVVAVGIYLLTWTIKSIKKAMLLDKEGYESIGYWIFGIIGTLAGLGLILGFGISAIDRIVAPEWNTAHDMVCLVKNCDSSSSNN